MARVTKESALLTRTQRLKLSALKRHFVRIEKGLHLCYRRPTNGAGMWSLRAQRSDKHNSYEYKTIGVADDYPGEGSTLTFDQAVKRALGTARREAGQIKGAPYTVSEALDDYLTYLTNERKSVQTARYNIEKHIRPKFKTTLVADLTTDRLKNWRNGLVPKGLEGDNARKKRATANRILTDFKATLNLAFENEKADSDAAWRRVKPFKKVEKEHEDFPTSKEVKQFLAACDPDFQQIALGTIYTAARYGDLCAMKVKDFSEKLSSVYVQGSKTDSSRNAPLTDEAVKFFSRISNGRKPNEPMFVKTDGNPWKKSHQSRPLREAAFAAGLPDMTLTRLRHFYGSSLVSAGMPLQAVAKAMGHKDSRTTEKHYARLREALVADQVRANLPNMESK